MSQDVAEFDRQWELFETKLRARMKKNSRNKIPSGTRLNAILKDCVLEWSSPEGSCGRWLKDLGEREPDKAQIISGILLEDMRFREEPVKKGISGTVKAVVPMAGAIAGLLFSRHTGADFPVQLLSTAAPAVMLAPAMQAVDERLCRSYAEVGLRMYLEQLEVYRSSVMGILQQG